MAEAPQTRPSLLVRVRNREDGPAWAQFVALYAPLIHGYARRHGLQDADAADLTQEVLRAVAAAVPRLEYDPERGSFRGWLFTVVRNKLRNFVRKQQQQPQPGTDGDACEELEQPAEPDTEWDQDYQRRVLAWAAERVRPSVAPATWEAFWQTAVEGRKASDVATQLGLAVASVYVARSRVLAGCSPLERPGRGREALRRAGGFGRACLRHAGAGLCLRRQRLDYRGARRRPVPLRGGRPEGQASGAARRQRLSSRADGPVAPGQADLEPADDRRPPGGGRDRVPLPGRGRSIIRSTAGESLHLAHCRLVNQGDGKALALEGVHLAEVRCCQLLTRGSACLTWNARGGSRLTVEGCLLGGPLVFECWPSDIPQLADIHLTRNTMQPFLFRAHDAKEPVARTTPRVRLAFRDNVVDGDGLLCLDQGQAFALGREESQALLRTLVVWEGENNLFPDYPLLRLTHRGTDLRPARLPADLDDWKDYWGRAEPGSRQGRAVFAADAEVRDRRAACLLSPQDYRLAPESPGRGAEVERVGPGTPYERWKTTADYTAWLKATGQRTR